MRKQQRAPRRKKMAYQAELRELHTPLNTVIEEQRCLHALTGRAPAHKLCAHNHQCGSCPYDQMLDEIETGKPARTHARERKAA
jgi:hypothetical protein